MPRGPPTIALWSCTTILVAKGTFKYLRTRRWMMCFGGWQTMDLPFLWSQKRSLFSRSHVISTNHYLYVLTLLSPTSYFYRITIPFLTNLKSPNTPRYIHIHPRHYPARTPNGSCTSPPKLIHINTLCALRNRSYILY